MSEMNNLHRYPRRCLSRLKPEVGPEVRVVSLVVLLVPLHRHPLVPVGLGRLLAGKEELVQ